MKRRVISGSGGASSLAMTAFSLFAATSPVPGPQTTPMVSRLPSGTTTKSPGATSSPR